MKSKYAPLEAYLRDSGRARMPMTFEDIERLIGARLPPAAFRRRALWSNDAGNWVMTKAWLAAGYRTERVDMEKRAVVFRKAASDGPFPGSAREASTAERTGSLADAFGALKDTVTISPGASLTDPIDDDWNAAR